MAPDLEDRVPREILEALIEEGTEAFRKVSERTGGSRSWVTGSSSAPTMPTSSV